MFIDRGATKSRTIPCEALYCESEYTTPFYGHPAGDHDYNYGTNWFLYRPRFLRTIDGIQITESDSNRWPPPKEGTVEDLGSEFYSRKVEILTGKLPVTILKLEPVPPNTPPLYGTRPFRFRFKTNTMIANAFGDGVVPNCNMASASARVVPGTNDLSSTRQQLVVKGAIAAAACAPSNQIAAAASAIGELLQDVPNIPGLGLARSRLQALEVLAKSSDEFLNVVFGVLPTISDAQSFVKGVSKVEDRVDQFIKDSGRNVRRKFAFPKERSESSGEWTNILSPVGTYATGFAPEPYGNWNLNTQADLRFPVYATRWSRVVEREIWFSGAFTYHLPEWFDTTSKNDRKRLMAELLGAKPDLNTLWQLTPWSWAVDWFTNASSYVKSLSALINYGTVMRYGYIMEKTTVTDTYSAGTLLYAPSAAIGGIQPPYPAVHPITLRTTVKKRVRANPFGFGLDWNGLSPVQLAITAALGITRVVR